MILTLHWSEIRKEHLPILGQKCARLADVKARLGVGVPPFFALTSHFVKQIIDAGQVPAALRPELNARVKELEAETGQIYGGVLDPLLFAVRSGDPISMVGTMATLLNIGMNDRTLNSLIRKYGHENAVSLWRMYLDLHVDMNLKAGGLTREAMRELLQEMKRNPADVQKLGELVIKARIYGYQLPLELDRQLTEAIRSVAFSWLGAASQSFIDTFKLDTGVYPSIMVQKKEYAAFVNRAYASFSTRNPLTGAPEITGDYALGTEGRAMMRGICRARQWIATIDRHFPGTYDLLTALAGEAEKIYKRPQDFEMIIMPEGRLIVLQVNDFIMPAAAHARVEHDLHQEGILQPGEQMPQIPEIKRLLVIKRYQLNPAAEQQLVDKGRPVSPGAVEGQLMFDPREAARVKHRGKPVILFTAAPDERALTLLLKREVDGLATTYHSVHDEVAARANHLPAAMGFRNITIEDGYLVNKATGQRIREGERVVLDGDQGLLLTSNDDHILIEHGHEIWAPYNINGERIFKRVQSIFAPLTYEQLLDKHGAFVKRSKGQNPQLDDLRGQQKKTRTELITHFIHLMLQEKGRQQGKSELAVNLDVAVHDGNMERVPGLEQSEITLERMSNGSLFFIFSTTVEFSGVPIQEHEVPNAKRLRAELAAEVTSRKMQAKFATTQKKLSIHTDWVILTGLLVPAPEVQEVIAILRDKLAQS